MADIRDSKEYIAIEAQPYDRENIVTEYNLKPGDIVEYTQGYISYRPGRNYQSVYHATISSIYDDFFITNSGGMRASWSLEGVGQSVRPAPVIRGVYKM